VAPKRTPVPKAAPARAAKAAPAKRPARVAAVVPRKTSRQAATAAAATKAPAKSTARVAATAKTPPRRPSAKTVDGHKIPADKFLAEQQQLLIDERASHLRQAESLREEADALAAEMEPGESEFGEEGGEGGNLSIERELDLVLSAQAKAAVDEIDRALAKIDNRTYGACEKCGREIPRARLKVLPHAPLCVACKSGGLSRR
jgi:DnaK suppressor protein